MYGIFRQVCDADFLVKRREGRPQTSWSTRVPCPGGSGGGGVGWASPASPALASTVGSAVLSAVLGALACGAVKGADGAIAETLTCKILVPSTPDRAEGRQKLCESGR
jgi:hypothetical protein